MPMILSPSPMFSLDVLLKEEAAVKLLTVCLVTEDFKVKVETEISECLPPLNALATWHHSHQSASLSGST